MKAELAQSAGSVPRALLRGEPDTVADALAAVVISCYLLGRRVGLDFARLDRAVLARLERSVREGHEMESWYGDLSQLRERFRGGAR